MNKVENLEHKISTIERGVAQHEELLASGKLNPVTPPAPAYAPIPGLNGPAPARGPIRGSYPADTISDVDFAATHATNAPLRTAVFPPQPSVAPNNLATKQNVSLVHSQPATAPNRAINITSTPVTIPTQSPVAPTPIGQAPRIGPPLPSKPPIQIINPNGGSIGGPSGPIPVPPRSRVPVTGAINSPAPLQNSPLPIAPRIPLIGTTTQDQMGDGLQFAKVNTNALTQNQIDSTKIGVLMKGSVPPMYSGAFTYTATTTSITISWNNLIIYRADGTITNTGSGSQVVTGLSAGTTYNFIAYWDEEIGVLVWVSSAALLNPFTTVTGAEFETNATTPGYVSTTTSLTRPASVSVECWFRSVNNVAGQPLVFFALNQTGAPSTEDFILEVLGGGAIEWLPGTTGITSPATYIDGGWHYLVGTYNGTTAILYIDGAQVASGSVTAAASFSGFWRMAYSVSTNTDKVVLSRAAVYSGIVLSAAQVTSHFDSMTISGINSYDANVLADGATYFWKLIETSGTNAADSADSNTGTYQNTGNIILNQSQQLTVAHGSPAIAWSGVPIQAVQIAVLQNHISLGILAASTPASGTGGGAGGGASGSGGGDKKVSG